MMRVQLAARARFPWAGAGTDVAAAGVGCMVAWSGVFWLVAGWGLA